MKFITFCWILLSFNLYAAPTEEREWRSTAGTQIKAIALNIKDNVVFLKTSEDRELKIPIKKFMKEDQQFLKKHFGIVDNTPKPKEPLSSNVNIIQDGLAHPIGQITGPVTGPSDGSTYYVYLPKNLRENRKAPLMFITSSSGGKPKTLKEYQPGADLNGWILAVSIQSKNGEGDRTSINHDHSANCLEHILTTLPIDKSRIYFSGNSGGAAIALYNSIRLESAGSLPFTGYSIDREYKKSHYCYGIGGVRDFNRYTTAKTAAEHRKRGFHRLAPGGHNRGPAWLGHEGMTWLNGRYLGDNRSNRDLDSERLDYETSVINWIKELTPEYPHRAHYLCHILTEDYKITGHNATIASSLMKDLEKDSNNPLYTEAIIAIDEFSEKYYANYGQAGGAKGGHTTPKIKKAAEKLAKKFTGVPEIGGIIKNLGEKTANF